MYKQIKNIVNIDYPGQPGWCLVYAAQVFEFAKQGFANATAAWNGAKVKHSDRNVPMNVSTMVFFSWKNPNKNYKDEGHVVVTYNGKFYSSPFSADKNSLKIGHKVFNTLEQIESYIGCKYVGWVEDYNGLKMIEFFEEEKPPVIKPPVTPPVQEKALKVGDLVKTTALKYMTGEVVPTWVRNRTIKVKEIGKGKRLNGVLLGTAIDGEKEYINSWVEESTIIKVS